ncbi:hypothetical protein Ae201684P_003378 [Aphanomyces euteiches]|uniref:Uncharacterized protein n=1 Tax=Aphanomyces euteiches TaxID=100861 RepID=A0A6G0X2Y2_9STRA|nr:hypothetical protein Ae201684_009017 [Aphanomyces euteiches]KAH9073879.1 hypothetical protein Ae201684P_003378 [Aphanomyces euteiches]
MEEQRIRGIPGDGFVSKRLRHHAQKEDHNECLELWHQNAHAPEERSDDLMPRQSWKGTMLEEVALLHVLDLIFHNFQMSIRHLFPSQVKRLHGTFEPRRVFFLLTSWDTCS